MSTIKLHQLTALVLCLGILTSYAIMVNWYPVAYIWGTYEDLYGEWGQTYFFTVACIMSAMVARTRSRFRWFFILLTIALFYTVMEEISWGQRIFNIESPDFFKDNNLQRETNLHNMLVGPFSTDLKELMEFLVASALFLYGVAYPLVLRIHWRPAIWVNRLGVASPPLYLLPFFLAGAIFEIGLYNFNEAEIAELLVGFALTIMASHYWLAQRKQLSFESSSWPVDVSRQLTVIIIGVFIAVATLSATTTYATYNNPDRRDKIDARLLNGYEKFAKRYSKYDRWDVSAKLLLQVHEIEPQRTSVLRRLAVAYREQGDEQQFLHYTNKALKIAQIKYDRNPNKISTNLTLSRTYKQLGQDAKAGQYGLRAHEIARERAEQKPDSAHWAYWLGKTYRNLGNYPAALEQFKKAFELKPSSKKYRKAYYRSRQSVGTE